MAWRSPFDLDDDEAYARWRDAKLAASPARVGDLIVDVRDPERLSMSEHAALHYAVARANMAIYRSPGARTDKGVALALGAQLGLSRLDANWLADEDGVSSITVSDRSDDRGGFIPYTDRPIQWHTDGYYHPDARRIRAMVLHCVRPACAGGANALLDHELVYIALRDTEPEWVRALMAPHAMTIPAREDAGGVARTAQAGPVFSIDEDGALHMRYTARTRSIAWHDDAATRAAVAFIERLLGGGHPCVFRLRLEAGMGIVSNNVLHTREGFADDPGAARLLYRARYLDRIGGCPARSPALREDRPESAWTSG